MANEWAELEARIEALGDSATAEQGERLTAWIVDNIAADYWDGAAVAAINIPGVYTDLRMRGGEGY